MNTGVRDNEKRRSAGMTCRHHTITPQLILFKAVYEFLLILHYHGGTAALQCITIISLVTKTETLACSETILNSRSSDEFQLTIQSYKS